MLEWTLLRGHRTSLTTEYFIMNLIYKLITSSFLILFLTASYAEVDNKQDLEQALNNYLIAEPLDKYWYMVKDGSISSFKSAMKESGKVSSSEIDELAEKLAVIIDTHLSYKSIESELRKNLLANLTVEEFNFLTKRSLKMISSNKMNDDKEKVIGEKLQLCFRLTIRSKIIELKEKGLLDFG